MTSSNQSSMTPNQLRVLNELNQALDRARAIDAGEPLQVGEATDIIVAIARAQRLHQHIQNPQFIAPLTESMSQLSRHPEWGDFAILESDYLAVTDYFVEVLKDPDTASLELMRALLEVDRLLCALSILSPQNEYAELYAEMIMRVDLATGACLERSAKLSERARVFVRDQGPQGAWCDVWEAVADADRRLTEVHAFLSED